MACNLTPIYTVLESAFVSSAYDTSHIRCKLSNRTNFLHAESITTSECDVSSISPVRDLSIFPSENTCNTGNRHCLVTAVSLTFSRFAEKGDRTAVGAGNHLRFTVADHTCHRRQCFGSCQCNRNSPLIHTRCHSSFCIIDSGDTSYTKVFFQNSSSRGNKVSFVRAVRENTGINPTNHTLVSGTENWR